MKQNMGSIDKSIRILLAFVFAALYLAGFLSGTLGSILMVLSVILILTSLIGTCPLYIPFGVNTCKKKSN
jgi:hypothetical protein